MSVKEHIDTTISLTWPGRRTIGTLASLHGSEGTVNALSGPDAGIFLTVTVEGDEAEEAIAIDGLCTKTTETQWGEVQIEFQVLRLGTLAPIQRLKDFIEQHSILQGGAVHVGRSRSSPDKQRSVYNLPEPDEAVISAEMTLPDAPTLETLEALERDDIEPPVLVDLPSSDPMGQDAKSLEVTKLMTAAAVDADTELENTTVFDTEALLADEDFDDALRDALQAIETPSTENADGATSSQSEDLASEDAGDLAAPTPITPDTEPLEPAAFLSQPPTRDDITALSPTGDKLMPLNLTDAEFETYRQRIERAVELEKESKESADEFDLDEPIIVSTVELDDNVAAPVQIGHDNRAPTLADAVPTAAPVEEKPGPEAEPITLEMPDPVEAPSPTKSAVANSTQRIEKMAPSLAQALTAPAPLSEGVPTERRRASGSMKKLQQLFHADLAVRCDMSVVYQAGKKKSAGQLVRLAESRLRIQTEEWVPEPYSRIQVLFEDPEGGKNKLAVHCEVVRVRDSEPDRPTAFDMRVSPGVTGAKEIGRLRALIEDITGMPSAGASA